MKKAMSFKKANLTYHADVYIFDEGSYDVTEFYSMDDDGNSIDVPWEPFTSEIELEIADYLIAESGGFFGGYDTFLEGLDKSFLN